MPAAGEVGFLEAPAPWRWSYVVMAVGEVGRDELNLCQIVEESAIGSRR